MYDFEPRRVMRFLKRHKVKRAAIQLPAGLRPHLREIKVTFEEAGAEVLILADSCYGACDLADGRARQLGCDALVHYGHSDMGLRTRLPTLYIEARVAVDPLEAVEEALPELNFKRLGLATTVQHIGFLPKIAKLLRSRGIKPLIGKPGRRARYPGQILGCDWGSVKSVSTEADGFLYIGTGRFHPLGIGLTTGRDVMTANPITGGYERLSSSAGGFLSHRRAMISRAMACERFGVLVSVKPGQTRFKLGASLVDDFKRAGLIAHLLVLDEISPEKLDDFKLEAFVCAACPRIPVDDAERFTQPILTPFEARAMLGKERFEPYQLDEVQLNDF